MYRYSVSGCPDERGIMRLGDVVPQTEERLVDEIAVANQEETLRQAFVAVLNRVAEDQESVRRVEMTFPAPGEATYRLHYRGFEDFEGGHITGLPSE